MTQRKPYSAAIATKASKSASATGLRLILGETSVGAHPRRNLQLRDGIGEVRKCLAAGPCSPKEVERGLAVRDCCYPNQARPVRGFCFLQYSASALRSPMVSWAVVAANCPTAESPARSKSTGPHGGLWTQRAQAKPAGVDRLARSRVSGTSSRVSDFFCAAALTWPKHVRQ
jgi:hypothetical protein